MTTTLLLTFITSTLIFSVFSRSRYEPTWKSLDSRPLPAWYDDGKFGIFVSWGLFSVPSFGDEWFWKYWKDGQKDYVDFMKNNYRPDFTYPDFAKQFTAEFYNPNQWADLFKAAGAKYIVFITKHHDGFCLWPSNVSWNWNSMDVGPKRDLVGEMAVSLRQRTDLHLGLYHSLFEWFNPLYLKDKANDFNTQDFVKYKTGAELYELVNTYKPDIIWSDGSEGPDYYWNSTQFLAWLYNDSPVRNTVVTNDRWGTGIACHHGGFFTCTDRYNPGYLVKHKWENAMTIDRRSWGFRREAPLSDYLTTHELLTSLVSTVSCGGNLLLNVGPTKDGRIMPIFEQRLREMGQWLKVNGEAIYGSTPWSHQNDTVTKGIWYTSKQSPVGTVVYAIFLSWPDNNQLILRAPTPSATSRVSLLGYAGTIDWKPLYGGGMLIDIPPIPVHKLPSKLVWVMKMTSIV